MKNTHALLVSLVAGVLVLALGGCYPEREPGQGNRAILKRGETVPVDMDGWVALPNTVPELKKSAELTYAVLATHNVISAGLDGWVAMDPAYFAKLSDIKIEAPKVVAVQPYVLKEGKSISKEQTGWVAVPNAQPEIIKSAREASLAMAELVRNQIVPKEMNGWVAIDRNTLSKLTEKHMMTGKGADLPKPK
jgi:hypothetical protein